MFETLFSQYNEYETIDIVLEIIGVLFGLASLVFAKENNIKTHLKKNKDASQAYCCDQSSISG